MTGGKRGRYTRASARATGNRSTGHTPAGYTPRTADGPNSAARNLGRRIRESSRPDPGGTQPTTTASAENQNTFPERIASSWLATNTSQNVTASNSLAINTSSNVTTNTPFVTPASMGPNGRTTVQTQPALGASTTTLSSSMAILSTHRITTQIRRRL